MKKYLLPITLSILLFTAGLVLALKGYVYAIIYGQVLIIFGITACVLLYMARKRQLSFGQYLSNCVIILLIGIIGMTIGSWSRVSDKKKICVECDKLIKLLEEYKEDKGSYPEKISDVNISILKDITIQQKKFLDSGIALDDIDYSDVTIYLASDEYFCLVPVTKKLPMSFTRFYAFGKNNQMENWKYDKMIWYFSAMK